MARLVAQPDLDLVEPRGVGRSKVEVASGTAGQPLLDPGVFVGAVVVDDQVNVQIRRHVRVDMA